MSCEDSLSQSILQSGEVHEQLPSQSTNALLDEVESIQEEILDHIQRKFSEPSKVKLASIKDVLQHVNKELTEEKQIISSWKVSLSQSFSQLEENLPRGEIKERAKKLVVHQKRLLSAFQRQKSISEKLRDMKYSEENQVNSITPSAAKGMLNQDRSSFIISDSRVCAESSQFSQESGLEAKKSSMKPAATSPNWTNRGFSGVTNFVQNSTSTEYGRDMKTQNFILQKNSDITNGDFTTGKDHQTPALRTIALISKTPVKVTKVIQKLQEKQPAIDGNKKPPTKRKRSGQKLQQCSNSTTLQSNKLDASQFCKGASENMTHAENSDCTALPFLDETCSTKEYNAGSLDVSMLKFIVMPKDEEFLNSSEILPIDFWEYNINQDEVISNEYLKRIGFC